MELEKSKDNLPDISRNRRGFEEGVTREELIIPRTKLLQFMSPELMDEETQDKFKVGQIINSITKDILPESFIPIFKFTEWIRFNPRDEKSPNFDTLFQPGALLWRTKDPNDPKVIQEGQFGPKTSSDKIP